MKEKRQKKSTERTSRKDDLSVYIKKKYGAEPQPCRRRAGGAVYRHKDSAKPFAEVLTVLSGSRGTEETAGKDILKVRLPDPFLADILSGQKGFSKEYCAGGADRIAILLDGTVPFPEVCRWVDESFLRTASPGERLKYRPPKEWIIPSNPKYYDIQGAFRRSEEIDWKQGKGIRTGDTVYMYVAAPVSAILYECLVTETDIPFVFDSGNVHMTSLMKIRLMRQYREDAFTFARLGEDFGIFAVRGPRGVPAALSDALKRP